MIGRLLIALGVVLAVPQVVMDRPVQIAFVLGVALAIAGATVVSETQR